MKLDRYSIVHNNKEMQNSETAQNPNTAQARKLQNRYLIDKEFQQSADKRNEAYQILYQQSLYSDLKGINEDILVCYNRGEVPVYLYFGALQDPKDTLRKLTLFFVYYFLKQPKDDFIFVYINTQANSNTYSEFKKIFLQLTLNHFLHLRQFILVRPTYMHRALDYFSYCPYVNYLRNITMHLYSCADLCKHLKINPQDFVDIVPKQISEEEFPNLIRRRLSLVDQRINLEGQIQNQKEKMLRKEFDGVIKSFLIAKPGKQTYNLSDYEINKYGIPIVLSMCVLYFKTNPYGLREEGLFRKSVSIEEESETLTELANRNYDHLLTISNPHIIANLIKRFFSSLKTPIIPYTEFTKLMQEQQIKNKKQYLKQIMQSLPELNTRCLIYLLQFLMDHVVPLEGFNKMSVQNVAICFAPCLMRAEEKQAALDQLVYAKKSVAVLRVLLDNWREIFQDSQYVEQSNRKSQEFRNSQSQKQQQPKQTPQHSQHQQPKQQQKHKKEQNLHENHLKTDQIQKLPTVPTMVQTTTSTTQPTQAWTTTPTMIQTAPPPNSQINSHIGREADSFDQFRMSFKDEADKKKEKMSFGWSWEYEQS